MIPKFRSITIISSPYHVGISQVAVGAGPAHLKLRRLVSTIRERRIKVDEVELPPVHDQFEGDIARSFEVFRRTAISVRRAHEQASFPIVIAGNCSSSVGVLAGISTVLADSNKSLACAWFDAHDDFNTPDTITSGYFDSMPIAMLGNLCFKSMLATIPGYSPLDLKRLIHVGMRDVNEIERQHVKDSGISVVWGNPRVKVDFNKQLAALIDGKRLDSQPSLVHVDLDSFDTSIGKANRFAAPGGLQEADMRECLLTLAEKTVPMSMTIASFDPSFEGADAIADAAIRCVSVFVDSLVAKWKIMDAQD
ncbi:hypothetical protein GGI43DRAFT_405834 [Trichoderma evansii]